MLSSKVCFKCGSEKPLVEFYKHPQMADGHLNKCKSCTKKDVQENRNAKIDYYRAYDVKRAKLPHRLAHSLKQCRNWRKADSRRSKCYNAVARALRNGVLQHKSCEWEGCEREDSMAHHESYDRPLDVTFYCQPHHKLRHKQMKAEGIIP